MPQRVRKTFYAGDSADLMELMDNVGAWAQNWGDVAWYLRMVGRHNTKFEGTDLSALIGYVEGLEKSKARFTNDYKEVYRELTGKECQECPDSGHVLKLNLRDIAGKWFKGLRFPASKEEALERAKANHAPVNIVRALGELDKPDYAIMGALLQQLSEAARQHV